MNIFDTHDYKLRFYIDKDAPDNCMKKWNKFKLKCERGDNKQIVEQIKSYCKLPQNKNIPYLNRVEGGMGGNNNIIHKQIRFRNGKLWSKLPKYNDFDIIFDRIENTDIEKWTNEELDDIIYGFIKTANYNIEAECVNGSIEMINKINISDYYLDNDSE